MRSRISLLAGADCETNKFLLKRNIFLYTNILMARQNLKLLVVDDEPDVCTYVQRYFGKRGFVVTTTGSGIEALSLIKLSKPDIVLLDITLNDLSGQEVLKKLRKYDKDTKVIVMTGNLFAARKIQQIKALGISAYLTKTGFGLPELERTINQILGNKFIPKEPETPPALAETTKQAAGSQGIPRDIVHSLNNLIGNSRNACEVFCLNVKEEGYETQTKEYLEKAVNHSMELMQDIIENLKQAEKMVQQI